MAQMRRTSIVAAVVIAMAVFPHAAGAADTITTQIVEPLREIGHVRATSSACLELAAGGGPAARATLAFERRLVVTALDFATYDASNEIRKMHGLSLLESDLRVLANEARAGDDELAALRERSLNNGTHPDANVVAFADALSGAQGRQMMLTRDLARIVGMLAERPVYSIVDGPLDRHTSGAFRAVFGSVNASLIHPDVRDSSLAEPDYRQTSGFFSLPGDQDIAHDLARAGDYARTIVTSEGCVP